jgi:hypothetical protein
VVAIRCYDKYDAVSFCRCARDGATCADAAKATLLGLPFEMWSGLWFGLCAAVSGWVLYRMMGKPRRLFS